MTARLLSIGPREYHADCHPDAPSLSASIANILLKKSPLHAWQAHPRLGATARPATPSMETGTLVHGILLGSKDTYTVLEYESFRTKDAQAARDAVLAERKAPVLRADFDEAVKTCGALRENIHRTTGLFVGSPQYGYEQVVVWNQENGVECPCRAMLDLMHVCRVYDLKTTRSAHPDDCLRSILSYGYDVQAAAYIEAWKSFCMAIWKNGKEADRVTFTFLFLELVPPFAVTPITLGPDILARAKEKWLSACRTWMTCRKSGIWPGYVTGPVTVHGDPKPVWGSEVAKDSSWE